MSYQDEFIIQEPNAFEGRTGKVIVICREGLVHPDNHDLLWQSDALKWIIPLEAELHYLGRYNGEQVFTVELEEQHFAPLAPQVSPLRSFLGKLPEGLFQLLGRAAQISEWHRAHRYCGYCGGVTTLVNNERATSCAHCGKVYYPRLSPCIMALITRGDECLLARNGQWQLPYFSVLAGFIEPGESAEEAVRREVMEEVGLRVGELHYKKTQPWPFPGQLMIGFFADYAGGDIQVDGIEIAEANWYHYKSLPNTPGEFALSGQLIRTFVQDRALRNGE